MNFKIQNVILNITNYPSVERHVEDMASKGWMLSKIILNHIFVYKKTRPVELDFSIVPYENETFFNKKSKEEIEKIKSENKELGWSYSAKTKDFQVYFKDKDKEQTSIIWSKDEEFSRLEKIGKAQEIGNYLLIVADIFLLWNLGKQAYGDVSFMKFGLSQLLIIALPMAFLMSAIDLVSGNKFLKINKENIREGEDIKYSDSKFYFNKIAFVCMYIFAILLVAYLLYQGIYAGETVLLISFLPVLIGMSVGTFLRFFVKSSEKVGDYKILIYIGAIIATVIAVNLIIYPIMRGSEEDRWKRLEDIDLGGDKVLLIQDFSDEGKDNSISFSTDISFLIPKSYEYTNRDDSLYLTTDYSKALNEAIARNLINRYRSEAEYQIDNWTDYSLEEYYYQGGELRELLVNRGLSREDLDEIKDEDLEIYMKTAKKMMKERSILEIDMDLWNVDQAYFLNYEKTEIVLRRASEVYRLYGMDFSDEGVREIVMEKLGWV